MTDWIRRRPAAATLAVFAVAFAVLVMLSTRDLGIFDEGIILVDAMRAGAGELVHRDYYSSYGPAAYTLVAGLFRLGTADFLIARIFGAAVQAGIVAAAFGLLAPRVAPGLALVVAAMTGAWLIETPNPLYPVFPVLLLALAGSALLLRADALDRPGPPLLAGVLAGAAALFRYDAGFFLAVAHLAAVTLLIRLDRRRWRDALRVALLYGAGTAAIFLPFAIAWLAVAPLASFRADIVDYTVHHYAAMRGLPFPGPRAVAGNLGLAGIYLPLVATAAAVLELIRTRARPPGRDALVLLAALTALFFYKGVVRVSTLHMMLAIVPSLMLLALVVDRWWPHRRLGALALAAIAALPTASVLAHELRRDVADPARTRLGRLLLGASPAERACALPPELADARLPRDYAAIARSLGALTAPGERIYAGLHRHDRIFINPISLYFAAGRLPGTHWHQLDPGLQTRADVQAAMIADLVRSDVRWVVRDASFDKVREPNGSAASSGVHLLDRFLARRYRPVAAAGPVELWLRRDVPALAMPRAACMAAAI